MSLLESLQLREYLLIWILLGGCGWFSLFFQKTSSSKRSLLSSFKYAFSILSLSNSSSSCFTCSTIVSTETISAGSILLDNLFYYSNDIFHPFFFVHKSSGPAILKSFTYLTIGVGLCILSWMANSWYETSLVRYNSTTWSLYSKVKYSFFLERINASPPNVR